PTHHFAQRNSALDAVDFGRNVHAAEFGKYGLCRVRFGKAKKGSPTKQRSVLSVWAWTPEVLEDHSGTTIRK
ncbi:MAG: hypothetical protein ACRDSM_22340, partial [Pseudonocardiaceae bacterium]